jgi:hypothetical protein
VLVRPKQLFSKQLESTFRVFRASDNFICSLEASLCQMQAVSCAAVAAVIICALTALFCSKMKSFF